MKCQILFFLEGGGEVVRGWGRGGGVGAAGAENKKNISVCRLLKILPRVLSVNDSSK